MITDQPIIASGMPRIAGQLKTTPAHFIVDEELAYQPSGAGSHVYLRLTREGMTTRELVTQLARLPGITAGEIGYAGLKDKQARVTQTVSIHLPDSSEHELTERVAAELPVTVESVSRHTNKLRRGHGRSKRFRNLVSTQDPEALQ